MMANIPVRAGRYWVGTEFDKPRLVGEYKVVEDGDVVLGHDGILYLNEKLVKEKNCALDLTVDRKSSVRAYNAEKKLEAIFKWIDVHVPREKNLKKACHDADFVCRRGVLSLIGQFPYDSRRGFEVVAVRYGRVIFLCEFQTDQKLHRETMSDREKSMSYWGQNFETYLTQPTLDSDQSFSEKADKGEDVKIPECRAVFLATFGKPDGLRVLLSAEMDCIDSAGKFVQLKTQGFSLHKGFWRNKSLMWWLQCQLVDISDIVVGFRDDEGLVTSLDTVKVANLAEDSRKTWSQHVPINFIGSFLKSIKETLEEEPELTYFLCEFKRNASSITVRPLQDSKQYEFIPESFIDRFDAGVLD